MTVNELYVSKGNVVGSTFVFMIMENGTPILMWYMGNSSVKEHNPTINKKTNGSMVIEYGSPNLFGVRQTLPFVDANGELEEKWEKIK